jgi:DNA repair protein RadD
MTPSLRPYQTTSYLELRENMRAGVRRQLLVSPTGSGKTVLFSFLTQQAASKRRRIGILCHRQELLGQISGTLQSFGVHHAIVAPGHVPNRPCLVQVASVFALARRLDRYPKFDVLIVDEAHHAIAGSTWGKIIAANPDAFVVGVTATPQRLGGEGLKGCFDKLVLGPSTATLIEQGYLSPYRLFAPAGIDVTGLHSRAGDYVHAELEAAADKPSITGDAVAHYKRLCYGKRALAFCVSIKHATHVAEQFRAAGIVSTHIDGTMDDTARRFAIQEFTAGRVQVLTSCDLVSEGFDLPAIEAAILLRPTQSLALYLQQVGRALRLYEGKKEAVILDHAGNVMRHGLVDQEREWTLDGAGDRKKRAESVVAVKQCPMCFSTVVAHALECRHCGHKFVAEGREVAHVEGELQEVTKAQAIEIAEKKAKRQAQGRAQSLDALVSIGMARGLKNPYAWARYIWNARAAKEKGKQMLAERQGRIVA